MVKEGTEYRIINVITSNDGKQPFQNTKKQASRHDLDGKGSKYQQHYMTLLNLYLSGIKFEEEKDINEDEFGTIDDPDGTKLSSFHLDINGFQKNIAHEEIDKLSCEDFERCLKYILAHYRQAKNNNTKSGNHGNFHEFTKKEWVVYLHMKLEEVGDKRLLQCAYPQLNDDIYTTSSSLLSPPSHSTSSIRSKSPFESKNRMKNEYKNDELSEAKVAAALGIVKEKEFAAMEKQFAAKEKALSPKQKLEVRFDDL